MIEVQGFSGRKVAVLGLGRSGLTAARALLAGGAELLLWDDNEAGRAQAEAEGFTCTDLSAQNVWDGVSALIVSPGIAHLYPAPHPIIAAAMAANVPVDNDIGLFFRSFATRDWDRFATMPKVIAVTGSNGKSTTAALLHHCLEHAGRPTQLAGNIGRGVLDLEPAMDGEVVVLELSSYQTELARALTPDIAVFTNLTPDHLDRHGGMGGYFAAKRRLFAEGGPDRSVIGVDEPEGQMLANQMSEGAADDQVLRVSVTGKLTGPGWSVFAPKGFLAEYRKGRQVASLDLRAIKSLPGRHNHQNACCVWAALRSIGIAPKAIADGFESFAGLPHRSQIIATKQGVTYVNDSKATNADSAAQALQAFDKIRWIAGGQAKEGGIEGLRPFFDRVAKAYLIGESAEEFAKTLIGTEYVICDTIAAAVAAASKEAAPGDTVLLAPAAASFDQYPDFEARGDDFIAAVEALD